CRELRERLHTYPPIIQDFLRYVHEHALKGLSLSEVARELAVTPTYLSSLIKKETGESFTDIVTRERLEVAKKLLTDTRNSIENIGSLIGYRNYISFYKAFKKLVGQTPREYRDHVSRG
ncbi:MAG: helix-turn-helix domain-containing protein, partial [Oscillospiraceae bacterium]|nr:helix-turn-helix domain-containing protein [Oscillospiraceae bacterium]